MDTKIKKLTFVMLIITFALSLGVGSKSLMADTPINGESETRLKFLNIMTVNKMQSNMIKELTSDLHNVSYMFESEKDIKKYKVTKDAIDNISNMDLFLYSGNSFEPWINDLTSNLNKNNVSLTDLSRGVREETLKDKEKAEVNPYYWTSINNYKVMLYNAKTLLQENDPARRSFYEDNYNKMLQKVDKANAEFQKVKGLDKFTFVTRNEKFNYFLNSIGINYTTLKDNESIEDFVKSKKIDKDKIVLIKDSNEKKDKDYDYKVMDLDSYNSNTTYSDLIIDNLKQFSKVVSKNNEKVLHFS